MDAPDPAARIEFDIDDVSVDHDRGGRLQAEHLVSRGHRRVALANSTDGPFAVVNQRIKGLENGLLEAGCDRPARMNLPAPANTTRNWTQQDFDRIRDFLRAHHGKIDAVAAVGDTLGLTVMAVALQMGLRVPEHLAIIGYDGIDATNNPLLSLTTIATPHAESGRKAFERLQDRIDHRGEPWACRRITCEPRLIVRRSTVGPQARVLRRSDTGTDTPLISQDPAHRSDKLPACRNA